VQLGNAIKLVGAMVSSSLQGSNKKSKINIGTASFVKIKDEIFKLSNMDKIQVQAEFQANLVLAGSIKSHEANITLLSDSDLAVLL
jgi:hypothetical protein